MAESVPPIDARPPAATQDVAPRVVTPGVSARTLVDFALPLAPVYLLYMMVTVVYMQFATDVLMIAPGVIGTVFFLSKIWDAISDPLVGYWSDRTRSRFGRRKSWIYASAPATALVTIMLWSPPVALSQTALFAWVVVSVLGFYTAFTMFLVPNMAYGIEIGASPEERAKVFGARQVALTLGMLAAFVIATPLITGHVDARDNARLVAGIGALAAALLIVVCTWRLPAERAEFVGRGARNPFAAFRDVTRNPHARLLLFVYFIEVFGIGATSAMTPFLLIYVTKATSYVGLVFLFYTIPAFLSIPIWIALAKRYEPHKLWRYAMGLQAIGYGSILLQEEGRLPLMIAGSIINGFATACGQTLGYAIKGDVIDYDEYRTGERKEGAYLAAWNLASKFGTGLMIAFSGWALQLSGFEPHAEQSELTKWTIKGMTGGAPLVCILIGMAAFWRFSLDRKERDRIRVAIDEAKDREAIRPPAPSS